MIKKIKNNTGSPKIWQGQEVLAGEYYEIQPLEESRWANDSQLLIDIGNAVALVNNGTDDITDIATAINYLKANIPQEVVTQFEKDDKILKLFSTSGSVGQDSYVTLEVLIPGTFASGNGRYIAGGEAWFDVATNGDKVELCEVVDIDNVLGYGAGTVLKRWHDEEAISTKQGWYFPIHRPILSVEPIGGYGFINSELYLRIKAKKANNITTGTLYLNIFWAKQE
jgi:hypothetical protein